MNKRAKATKKKAPKKKAKGMQELLGLLKAHPHLVHSLVFDPKKVKRYLSSRAARRLVSPPTKAFLKRVAGPESGGRGVEMS
jgi:hypothetical protein